MYLNKEYTKNSIFVVMLSCFMVACTQAGITMYSPSMPYLVGVFHVGYSYIVYTLTAYLLGYAIAMLFLGGASDQIGRKKSYLIAVTIFTVTSLSLAIINSIAAFVILRFLQGLGGGGCAIIGRASVRDVCEGKKLVKAMSYISISFIVSMGVFQYLGGLVQAYSNYKIDFIIMFGFGLIGLISVIFGFKETHCESKNNVAISRLIKEYWKIIGEKYLPVIALGGGVGYSLLIAFNILGIYYLQHQLNVTPGAIGILGIYFSLAYLLGTLLTNILIHVYDITVLIKIGKTIILSSGILALICYALVKSSIVLIIFPVLLGIFGQALLYPCAMTIALHPYKKSAGAASSLFGFIQQFIGFLVSIIAGCLPAQSLISLAVISLGVGLISFILLNNRMLHQKN
jgi:MFS family permease